MVVALTGMVLRSQEVSVDVRAPESCKTGDKCVVELVIEKQGVEGFARIQQTLPEGLTAELVNDAGSDFIFDKQRVSFIWLSLPPQQIISVSYRIVFNPSFTGTFEISDGSFSYLRDNKIQKKAIAPHTIAINMKASTVAVSEKKPDVTRIQAESKEQEKGKETEAIASDVQEKIKEKKPEIITEVPDTNKDMAEVIKTPPTAVKENISIPPKRDSVKILPDKPKEPVQPDTGGADETGEEAAKLPGKPAVTKTEQQEDKPSSVTKKPEISPVETTNATVKTATRSGTQYRVQFAALKTQKQTVELKKQFNINEDVFIESDGTWHRYTFGPWSTYAEADAARKAFIEKNGGNAMVIKYRDGKRLP